MSANRNLIVLNAIQFMDQYGGKDELLKRLLEVERLAWGSDGENLAASFDKIQDRVDTCPRFVFLALLQNKDTLSTVGSQFAFTTKWDGDISVLGSWDDFMNKGWIGSLHEESGKTGVLVGVGVIKKYRGEKFFSNVFPKSQHKASELLIAFALESLFNSYVEEVIGNARVPGYHTLSEENLEIQEYCSLREPNGLLFDPVLRFHERMGAEILKPVNYAMEDPESLNCGCWVIYRHRFNS